MAEIVSKVHQRITICTTKEYFC